MTDVNPRVIAALEAQLRSWRRELEAGGGRVGWKVAYDIPEIEEVVGDEPVIGHLTTATLLDDGDSHSAAGARALRAEVELAVEAPGSGFAVALELVDVDPPQDDLEGIVAANVFHRAVALGGGRPDVPPAAQGRLLVNGELREGARVSADIGATPAVVARQLEAVGERLEPGDRILTGAIARVPVGAGDRVRAEIDGLGGVEVEISD
ncbi:MAG TPA: fumarylacetoacetate hydrolase family protein [Thermoleophilaceae bacterium]|nr:fumarylacetoacetate hydrolase family protein [Thermoleophilaceae bacterium]